MSQVKTRNDTRDRWELFPHDADIGTRGLGETKAEAFENAARAMMAACLDLTQVRCDLCVAVSCSAPDDEVLLVDWLNALIFEMATRRMVFGDFRVRIEDHRLEGEAWGEPADSRRHAPSCEHKGATYTALRVFQRPDGLWCAECVVDV